MRLRDILSEVPMADDGFGGELRSRSSCDICRTICLANNAASQAVNSPKF